MENIAKWRAQTEYVDLETGEVITKSEYERSYYKIRNSRKTIIEEVKINNEILKYGIIKHTTECRRKPEQFELFK